MGHANVFVLFLNHGMGFLRTFDTVMSTLINDNHGMPMMLINAHGSKIPSLVTTIGNPWQPLAHVSGGHAKANAASAFWSNLRCSLFNFQVVAKPDPLALQRCSKHASCVWCSVSFQWLEGIS